MKNQVAAKLIKELIFWLAIVVIMFVSLQYIGLNIIHRSPKTILLLCFIFLGSVLVHLYKGSKRPDYIKNEILTLKSNSGRWGRYDWLRVIAASLVIITHAIQADTSGGYITEKNGLFGYTVIYTLALSCNLIYVMLSGALLLPFKEEKLSDFYLKRVSKVGFPLVIYYIFYLWQSRQLTNITPSLLKDICYRLIKGTTPESPHYWLIYTILSLYIVIPFFRYMMKNMSYKMLTSLSAVIIFFMTLNTFSKITLAINTFLVYWIGIAIIGYWVTREETRKYDIALIIVGIITTAIAVYLIRTKSDFIKLICNCSPIMTLITVGIFAFVFKLGKVFDKGNWIVRILSKYSYSIILIHWWSLYHLTINSFGIRANMYGGAGVLISYIVTVVVSLWMAFLIDNLVVTLVDYIFNFVIKTAKKLIAKITQCTKKTSRIQT